MNTTGLLNTTGPLGPAGPRRDRPPASRAARAGARDVLPLLAGVAPFGAVIGVAIHAADIDRAAGWASSFLICAGAAQLAVVELLDRGAAPLAILGTVALVNSRFVLYSAGLSRWFGDEPLRRRLALAFPVVDQLYVLCTNRFEVGEEPVASRRAYFAGAAVVLVAGWVAVQSVAVLVAPALGDLDALRLSAPLAFVGLLAVSLRDRAAVRAACGAAAAAVAAVGAPHHTGLLIAIAAGVALGSLGGERAT